MKGPFAFEPIGPGDVSRVGLPIRSLCFLDNHRLLATVVTRAGGVPGLAKRDEPSAASPFRLNIVIIDAATGKILAVPSWPSNSRYAGVIAANGKGLVIQTGTEFTLLSPGLRPIKRLTLPPVPADKYGHETFWNPRPSWSGRRILLTAFRTPKRFQWLWVDAENLQVLRSWEGVLDLPLVVSDRQIVMGTDASYYGAPPPILQVSVPGGPWKPLPSTLNPASPQFVGPGLLYFHTYATLNYPEGGGTFLVLTDGGAMSSLWPPLSAGWGLGRAAASRDGNRFVILGLQLKGSHPRLDVAGYTVLKGLVVYDSPFRAPSYTVPVLCSRIRNPELPALSPNGRYLAVFAYPKPIFEAFRLPPPK